MQQSTRTYTNMTGTPNKGRVLYVGHSYYHTWYLSRELRKLGWKADVLNWDPSESSRNHYHGEDFMFLYRGPLDLLRQMKFYGKSIRQYDIFHFSNAHGMSFGQYIHYFFQRFFSEYAEIKLLRKLGKKIVYSHSGCLDGVAQSSFNKWEPYPACDICKWKNTPDVCNDDRNLAWGVIRNALADYQITTGANRVDYNNDPRVHEVPEFYCLDHNVWNPDLLVPTNYHLPFAEDTLKIYHSIGNYESRTDVANNRNIKCTHIYLPLIERLKSEGYKIELNFFKDVSNIKVRYYQVQADIVVDMLTFGWFGANVREGMMLGKPCICFLRPEWLAQVRLEIPEYADELPVISATPDTIYDTLKDLVDHPKKRREIGQRSREFAVKWHSAEAGARRLDQIYSQLLNN